MNDKVIVTFTKPWRGYSRGEVAGFVEDTASSLIGGGVATLYALDTAAAAVPKGPKPGKTADKALAAKKPAATGTGAVDTPEGPADIAPGALDLGGGSGTLDPAGAGDAGGTGDPDDEKP